uniref:nitric-oxide synthase (NADPH) n=1 Tax=Timema poppense TaxID=170557 RepID=A0A7R9DGL6_TIMPO|nr:unnamed protein product [Timema poppensis]
MMVTCQRFELPPAERHDSPYHHGRPRDGDCALQGLLATPQPRSSLSNDIQYNTAIRSIARMQSTNLLNSTLSMSFISPAAGQTIGKAWLFFGCRQRSLDLYRKEKQYMLEDKVLDRVFLALSREPTIPKTYVQDLIRKEAATVYQKIVVENGHFYVCGDCTMAEHVLQMLKQIIQEHGRMTDKDVENYMLKFRGMARQVFVSTDPRIDDIKWRRYETSKLVNLGGRQHLQHVTIINTGIPNTSSPDIHDGASQGRRREPLPRGHFRHHPAHRRGAQPLQRVREDQDGVPSIRHVFPGHVPTCLGQDLHGYSAVHVRPAWEPSSEAQLLLYSVNFFLSEALVE